jgi:hypothetical protein
MNSTISKWLEGLDTKDVAAKDQLKNGLQHLIDDGNESGVWNVIACASSSWIANVNSIETLTNEVCLANFLNFIEALSNVVVCLASNPLSYQ